MPVSDKHSMLDKHSLLEALSAFTGVRVLIVGDVMLDEYLTGDAERISPEAPVPVVRIESERHLVGGAGNVARNIMALGGSAVLIGTAGRDAAGDDMARCLDRDGVAFSLLPLESRPTTIKTRVLARQQQVVRIDRENCSPLRKEETETLLSMVQERIAGCGAVVVSDYGKGLVSREFMQGLGDILKRAGRPVPVLVDPKPQNVRLYEGVTLLTPNAKEASESVNMPVRTREEVVRAGREIMTRLRCEHLVITLGSQGMAVFTSARRVWQIPTAARQVFDVTGAGDTVISTLALGAAAGLGIMQACLLANHAAGIVVAQVGAATASVSAIRAALEAGAEQQIQDWTIP